MTANSRVDQETIRLVDDVASHHEERNPEAHGVVENGPLAAIMSCNGGCSRAYNTRQKSSDAHASSESPNFRPQLELVSSAISKRKGANTLRWRGEGKGKEPTLILMSQKIGARLISSLNHAE